MIVKVIITFFLLIFLLKSHIFSAVLNVNSLYSTSNPFRGVENITLPTDGDQIEANYLTNDDVFHNGNTYLRLHHLPDSPNWDVNNFWQYNHSAQTFTLEISEVSSGAQWRAISTKADGTIHYQGWSYLIVGTNYKNLNAQGNDRAYAGFQTYGSFKFTKFSHAFAGYTQTNPNTFGYEEIVVTAEPIPESRSYTLVLGVITLFVAFRRNQRGSTGL